jgi:hypothetical protein
MTMMNVLEGIAAGAVLEDARVCEVGQAGWTSLADMAYAREEAPPGQTTAPAEPSRPRAGSSVRKLSDDFLQERWTPQRQGPADRPRPPAGRAPPLAPRATAVAKHPPSGADAPRDLEPAATWEWAGNSRAGRYAGARTVQYVEEMPSASPHSFADPADVASLDAAYPAQAERPKSGDFSLSLAEADEELDAFVARHSGAHAKRRMPWTLIAAGGGVAVLAALWFTVGDRFLGSASGDRTPAPAAAPGTDPVEDAWRALNTGDATTALAAFRRLVEDKPEDARVQHGLGLAALQSNDLELATAHLERATALSPQDARMRLDLGTARLREGRWELAVQQANQAESARESASLPAGRMRPAVGGTMR